MTPPMTYAEPLPDVVMPACSILKVQQHTNQNSGVMLIITYPNIPARYVELNTTTGNLSYQLENGKLIKIYLYALYTKDGVYTARLQYREFSRW